MDKRFWIHSTENIILRFLEERKSLRTQNKVKDDTQIRRNQKFFEINRRSEVRKHPETKRIAC